MRVDSTEALAKSGFVKYIIPGFIDGVKAMLERRKARKKKKDPEGASGDENKT